MVVVGGWAAAKLDETNSCTYIWINFCIFELYLSVLEPRTYMDGDVEL